METPAETPQAQSSAGSDQLPPPRRFRRLFNFFAGLILAPLIVFLLVLALLQIEVVQIQLLAWTQSHLEKKGIQLQLTGLHGIVPINFSLERLTVSDNNGKWLELKNAYLNWRPLELFLGKIHLQEIGLRSLFLKRLPHIKNEADDPESDKLNIPSGFPTIILEKIAVPEIILDKDLLGEKIKFAINGEITASSDNGANAFLELQRLDQKKATLNLTAQFDSNQILTVNLTANESGGLIQRLTKLPLTGTVDLIFQGHGPISNWPGELTLRLPGVLKLATSSMQIALGKTPHMQINGIITPSGTWIKPKLATLFGKNLNFAINLQYDRPKIILEKLQLITKAAHLSGYGKIDLAQKMLNGLDLALAVDELEQIDPQLIGAALLKLHGDGQFIRPNFNAILTGHEIAIGKIHLKQITAQARANLISPIKRAFLGINIDLEGKITGLTKLENLNWHGTLKMPSVNKLEILNWELGTRNARVAVNGTLNPKIKSGELNLYAKIPDLSPWRDITQRELRGAISLDSQIKAENDNLTTQIQVNSQELRNLPEFAEKLLGRDIQLQATAHLQKQRDLVIENLTLKSRALNGNTKGIIGIENDTLALRTELHIPQAELIAKDALGLLNMELNLDGTFNALRAVINLNGKNLKYAQRNLHSMEAHISATSLIDNPRGDINLRLGIPAQTLELRANFHRNKEKEQLAINNLSVIAPATLLAGAVNLDFAHLMLDGELHGRVSDIAALNSWTNIPGLQGAAEFNLALNGQQKQKLFLSVNGKQIRAKFARIENLNADIALTDLKNGAGINARINAQGLQREEQKLNSLAITAQGNIHQLDINASALASDFRLGLGAQLGIKPTEQYVNLHTINGEWHGKSLRLITPAKFIVNPKKIQMSQLGLNFGGAVFSAEGVLDPRTINATVTFDPIPLQLFADFGIADLAGSANATLNINGSPRIPRVELIFNAHRVQANNKVINKLPEAEIAAYANLDSGNLTAQLNLSGITANPVQLQFTTLLHLSFMPFNFNWEQRAPIAGNLHGVVNLARLSELLALDDHILAGEMRTAINLAGTIELPKLDGNLIIANGRYENGQLGTILKDINLDLRLDGQKLTIASLNATDGGKGRIQGRGVATLDLINRDLQMDCNLNLDKMAVLRSDIINAILDGALTLTGDIHKANLNGKLTVVKSELRIPEKVTPSVPKLTVREIPDRARNRKKKPFDDNQEKSLYPIDLDIAVVIPTRTFVRGRGLDSEWRGNLAINGLVTAPRVTGQLRVQRGIFDFLDRRFRIQEGVLDFHGGSPPIPNLNLKTEASGRDITAILSLSGTATQPKLTLESQPVFPQDEVLARLLFDREAKAISAVQAMKLAIALRTLTGSGGAGIDLLGKTRTTLGLDTLDMEGQGESESALKAGKYLHGNVYLEVESSLATGSSAVRVEKEISRQLSVETSVEHDASSAFGINWKIDY